MEARRQSCLFNSFIEQRSAQRRRKYDLSFRLEVGRRIKIKGKEAIRRKIALLRQKLVFFATDAVMMCYDKRHPTAFEGKGGKQTRRVQSKVSDPRELT